MAEEKRNFNGIPRDFYYGNTYPNDQDKATRMGGKVFYDLKPFSELTITNPPYSVRLLTASKCRKTII